MTMHLIGVYNLTAEHSRPRFVVLYTIWNGT